jgi:hypothetical protein
MVPMQRLEIRVLANLEEHPTVQILGGPILERQKKIHVCATQEDTLCRHVVEVPNLAHWNFRIINFFYYFNFLKFKTSWWMLWFQQRI